MSKPDLRIASNELEEPTWPADEHLVVGTKLIGLQFKRAEIAKTSTKQVSFDRLKWSFHKPAGQFALVQKRTEIFYCLPTFLNRDWRKQALHHCLFWRPGPKSDRNAWYSNANARTINKRLNTEPRWGLFIERLFSCEIGKKIESINEAQAYRDSLVKDLIELPKIESEEIKSGQEPNPLETFLLSIKVES